MRKHFSRFVSDYGMLFVLLLLCGYFSWVTEAERSPEGAAGGRQVAASVLATKGPTAKVLIVSRDSAAEIAFADAAAAKLGSSVVAVVKGQPPDLRDELEKLAASKTKVDAVAATQSAASWALVQKLAQKFPEFAGATVVTPRPYRWPNFLTSENLINIANRIAVIAIIAIGMTMVIITAGIDLSVGSLIALASVCAALLIERFGGESAGTMALVLCSLGGIAVCAAAGFVSGVMVAALGIPSFIVTLGMMLVASGAAYKLSGGESVNRLPDSFMWLGRGTNFGIPNAVILMIALYLIAHVVMSRTTLGRYIYAVGGNAEAARLSGIRVRRVLLVVYTVSGALAGLGGIITASLFKSGDPKYGPLAELYVIAAVVVGGTSLMGGQGKVLGTLIGALIIAVIENGMNLTNVESYTQKIVLGAVILGAVALDTLKKKPWWRRRRLSQ
jgi:ribose transport system permease protein